MPIRATDDEALAIQLWGDSKVWDDERKQYVPTKEEEPCPGNSSAPSETASEKPTEKSESSRPSTARTTARPSKSGTASSTARSTGGRGKAGS
jgi:hypothetical protein